MWRFWTRGWGPRSWWHWFANEAAPIWVAWHLPRRLALWVFIRVYSWDGQSPGPDYDRVYRAWEAVEAGRPAPPTTPPGKLVAVQGSAVTYVGPPYGSALGFTPGQRTEPTALDLADPRFDVLWLRLKHLDITGNDVAALLHELDAAGVGA